MPNKYPSNNKIRILHDSSTSSSDGLAVNVNSNKAGIIIAPKNATYNIYPEVSFDGVEYASIGGIRADNQTSILSEISGTLDSVNIALEFDVERYLYFRTRLEISSGSITIKYNESN